MNLGRIAVASLLGLSVLLPAAAPDEPLVPCEDTAGDVINEGESAGYDGLAAATPDPSDAGANPGNRAEITTVAGSVGETAIKATITATMTWDLPGDLELRAFDADGAEIGNSTAFNPTDGNIETVTVTVDPCADVTFVVDNYLGVPATPVHLEVEVAGKRPRVRN